jgi:hypothetical protein
VPGWPWSGGDQGDEARLASVPIPVAAGGETSTFEPAWLIAACALVFTVASFWWIQVWRGRTQTYAPHSLAAAVTTYQCRIPGCGGRWVAG